MSLGVAGYCRTKGLNGIGTRIELEVANDPETKLINRMDFTLFFPADFPEEHRAPIREKVADCYVKRHLFCPPEVTVKIAE